MMKKLSRKAYRNQSFLQKIFIALLISSPKYSSQLYSLNTLLSFTDIFHAPIQLSCYGKQLFFIPHLILSDSILPWKKGSLINWLNIFYYRFHPKFFELWIKCFANGAQHVSRDFFAVKCFIHSIERRMMEAIYDQHEAKNQCVWNANHQFRVSIMQSP